MRYWLSSAAYVDARRKQDVRAWLGLEAFVWELRALEKAEGFPDKSYDAASIRGFLVHEVKVAAA